MGQGQPLPQSGMRGGGINPHDAFVNVDGALEMVVRSKKPKAVELVKWLTKKGVEKLQEDHQKAIEERDTRIQAIEYKNVGLQGEIRAKDQQIEASQNIALRLSTLCRIAELVERYVDHCRNPSKDNIVIIIRKHTTPENDKYHNFPYYISRIQRCKRYVKLRWLERHFPDHEVIVEIDNPNSIHVFNRLEDRLQLSKSRKST